MPLPADTGRIWAAVPPFGRNAYSGHRFARDEKKSRKNKIATSPRSADCCPCPSAATDWRDGFTHLRVGQAERLACRWQPNAFCGLAPAPTLGGPRAEGQREERRIRPMPEFKMPLTKRTPSPGGQRKPPLFGPVSRCVGRMGPGWHPWDPCRLSLAAVGSLCGSAQIPLSPMPSGSYECSDNSSRNHWLSEKSSGMVCFPATPYQNFYAREEAKTWRPEQETGSSPFG